MTVTNARPSPRNAWTRPLQSDKGSTSNYRSSKGKPSGRMPAPPPGLSAPTNRKTSTSSNAVTTEDVLRERFLHLQLSLVDKPVTITRKDGSIIEGTLHTSTPFNSSTLKKEHRNQYVIKACKLISKATSEDSLKPVKDGSTAIIPMSTVSQIVVKSLQLETKARGSSSSKSTGKSSSGAFRTDTDISGGVNRNKSDDLVFAGSSWTSSSDISDTLNKTTLEDTSSGRGGLFGTATAKGNGFNNKTVSSDSSELKGKIGQWDQFAENENKFGVKATFDENLYTTSLNMNALDEKKRLQAERIAKEIEGTSTTNIHLAEERGQSMQEDYDEEDLYSGVLVKDGSATNTKERTKLVLKPRSADIDTENKADKTSSSSVKSTSSTEGTKKVPATSTTTPSAPKPTMNYAAAAAKADVNKSKHGSSPKPAQKDNADDIVKDATSEKRATASKNDTGTEDKSNNTPKETSEESASSKEESERKESTASTEVKKDEKETKPKTVSKLNANAKSFSFNPSAKSFTPSFATPAPAAPPTPIDPQPPVAIPPQYVQYPQMQPGIPVGAPIMHYQPYPGNAVRYPQGNNPPFMMQGGGMMPMSNTQVQTPTPPVPPKTDDVQPQHDKEVEEKDTEASPTLEESEDVTEESKDGDNDNTLPSQPVMPSEGQGVPQHQQGVQMIYGVPHSGYYPNGVPIHPGGRGPSPQHYPPQMAQQIPVVPGRNPYSYNMSPGHMQGGMHNVPPYNQVRDAGGYPGGGYMAGGYGGGPGQGGHGGIEDDMVYRGGNRGGRGRNGGRRGRKGGRGNGGRGYHNSYHSGGYSNNNSQQQQQQQQHIANDNSNAAAASETNGEGQQENSASGSAQ